MVLSPAFLLFSFRRDVHIHLSNVGRSRRNHRPLEHRLPQPSYNSHTWSNRTRQEPSRRSQKRKSRQCRPTRLPTRSRNRGKNPAAIHLSPLPPSSHPRLAVPGADGVLPGAAGTVRRWNKYHRTGLRQALGVSLLSRQGVRHMGDPTQRTACASRRYRSSCHGPIGLLGLSSLLLFSGCAQLDQLMDRAKGDGFGSAESSPSAQEQGKTKAQPAEPDPNPVAKTPDASQPAETEKESHPQPAVAAPARPPTPATSAATEPEPDSRSSEQDKTLVEKEQPAKEKKSRAAADRKSKKSAKPKPSTEDEFLPPIPPPSKPAAIGGSGG